MGKKRVRHSVQQVDGRRPPAARLPSGCPGNHPDRPGASPRRSLHGVRAPPETPRCAQEMFSGFASARGRPYLGAHHELGDAVHHRHRGRGQRPLLPPVLAPQPADTRRHTESDPRNPPTCHRTHAGRRAEEAHPHSGARAGRGRVSSRCQLPKCSLWADSRQDSSPRALPDVTGNEQGRPHGNVTTRDGPCRSA